MDETTRTLGRAAALGDSAARARLDAMLTRRGQPPWMRKVDALEEALVLVAGPHATKALDAIGPLRKTYAAAEAQDWPTVTTEYCKAMAAFQDGMWMAQRRRSPENWLPPLPDFDWPTISTEVWVMAGRPERDPRVNPMRGDLVGRRRVTGLGSSRPRRGAPYNEWRRMVSWELTDERGISTRQGQQREGLKRWREWARDKPVVVRVMTEADVHCWRRNHHEAEEDDAPI